MRRIEENLKAKVWVSMEKLIDSEGAEVVAKMKEQGTLVDPGVSKVLCLWMCKVEWSREEWHIYGGLKYYNRLL